MEYTKKTAELKDLFSLEKPVIDIPGSSIRIFNSDFHSNISSGPFQNNTDLNIRENISFTYPVFAPSSPDCKKAIILFHGLNERSWQKYLAWAYYLAEHTCSYVILFPISFHINRSPSDWGDPRVMMQVLKENGPSRLNMEMSSFANIAISTRLAEDPLRFFNSGYTTVLDVVDLVKTIRAGKHPFIPKNAEFNIFAYSIGAFMAEIILMGNPESLFSDSRLFIFCGGSVFSTMQGTSKLIMNKGAFDRVYSFYLNDFEESIGKSPLREFFTSDTLGMSFRSMIDFSRLKQFREKMLKKLRDQIHSISLLKDSVIPPQGVTATLNDPLASHMAEVWDFPYEYSHENPFPVSGNLEGIVDHQFERVFLKAANFLV